MKRSLLLLSIVLFSGCVQSFIPKNVRQQAKPGVTFRQVLEKPENFKGTTVLWGGQILRLKNAKEGTTLYLLQVPVDSEGKPGSPEASEGRYIVFVPQYLDMAVYANGRRVTILGQVDGFREEPLGEMTYKYPFISADKIFLWSPENPNTAPLPWYSHIGLGVGVGF